MSFPTSGDAYAFELRPAVGSDYLIGPGATFDVATFDGWGRLTVENNDVAYSLEDGGEATLDRATGMAVVITGRCTTGAIGTMEQAIAAARTAWWPTAADAELHAWIPGEGHQKVVGRTRGIDPTRVFPAGGIATVTFEFLALVPEIVSVA